MVIYAVAVPSEPKIVFVPTNKKLTPVEDEMLVEIYCLHGGSDTTSKTEIVYEPLAKFVKV